MYIPVIAYGSQQRTAVASTPTHSHHQPQPQNSSHTALRSMMSHKGGADGGGGGEDDALRPIRSVVSDHLAPLELKHSFGDIYQLDPTAIIGSKGNLLTTNTAASTTVSGSSSPVTAAAVSSNHGEGFSPNHHHHQQHHAAVQWHPADQLAITALQRWLLLSAGTAPLCTASDEAAARAKPRGSGASNMPLLLTIKDWVLVLAQVSQRRSVEGQRRALLTPSLASSVSPATTLLQRALTTGGGGSSSQ